MSIRSVLFCLAIGTVARGGTINVYPTQPAFSLGSDVTVVLSVSGLGNHTAPSLGAYDLDLQFDPAILSFATISWGTELDGGIGLSFRDVTQGLGLLNVFEVSLISPASDLDQMQPGSFELGTLLFHSLAVGTSPLSLTLNTTGDAAGDPLAMTVTNGAVSVTPEPGVAELTMLGLIAICSFARLNSRRR